MRIARYFLAAAAVITAAALVFSPAGTLGLEWYRLLLNWPKLDLLLVLVIIALTISPYVPLWALTFRQRTTRAQRVVLVIGSITTCILGISGYLTTFLDRDAQAWQSSTGVLVFLWLVAIIVLATYAIKGIPRMDTTRHLSSRPLAVKFAVILLAVSASMGIVKITVSAHLDNPLTYVVLALSFGVSFLLVWFIFRGKNWARWVFLILFALELLFSPRSIQGLQMHSTLDAVFYCVQLLLQLVAVVALFLRPSSQWFRGHTSAA